MLAARRWLRPLAFAVPCLLGVAGVGVLTVGGCGQNVGDHCQIDSDCADSTNNLCQLPTGGNLQAGGTCQPRNGATSDAGTLGDFATPLGDMFVPADGGDMTAAPTPDLTPTSTPDLTPVAMPDLTPAGIAG